MNAGSTRDEKEEVDNLELTTAEKGGIAPESSGDHLSSSRKDTPSSPERKSIKKIPWPTFETCDEIANTTDIQAVIQRKADSLGLLSRKWAKNFLHGALVSSFLTRNLEYSLSPPVTEASSKMMADSQTGKLTEDYYHKMSELRRMYNTKSRQMNNRGIPSTARQCRAESRLGSNSRQGRLTRPPTRSSTGASLPREKRAQHSATPQSKEAKQSKKTLSQTARVNGRQGKLWKETDRWQLEGEKWTMGKISQLEGILEVQQRLRLTTAVS